MSAKAPTLKKKVQRIIRDIKNTSSRITYKPATLNPKQEHTLSEMKQNGFVMLPAEEVFSPEQWENYCKSVAAFIESPKTQEKRNEYYAAGKTEGNLTDTVFDKTFILRGSELVENYLKVTPLSELNNNTFLKPVIDNYYGQLSKVIYVDYWYTLKTQNPTQDVYSQSWHCDPEGDKIVKVFVYFSDVDARSGALQYIKGSQHDGKNAAVLANIKRHVSYYPEQSFIDKNFPKDDIIQASAPKGTVVVCDTRGLHRGGKCLDNERIMGVLEFLDAGSFAHAIV